MKRLTREDAIKLGESGWWKGASDEEIVRKQLFAVPFLCIMNFSEFHIACERVFEMPIYTHQFASEDFLDELRDKFVDKFGPVQ